VLAVMREFGVLRFRSGKKSGCRLDEGFSAASGARGTNVEKISIAIITSRAASATFCGGRDRE
jgi:hypothetical protein